MASLFEEFAVDLEQEQVLIPLIFRCVDQSWRVFRQNLGYDETGENPIKAASRFLCVWA